MYVNSAFIDFKTFKFELTNPCWWLFTLIYFKFEIDLKAIHTLLFSFALLFCMVYLNGKDLDLTTKKVVTVLIFSPHHVSIHYVLRETICNKYEKDENIHVICQTERTTDP